MAQPAFLSNCLRNGLPCCMQWLQMHVSQPEDVELGVLLVSWLHDGVMPRHVWQCQHSLLVLLNLAGYYQLPCLVDSLLTWLLVQLHGQPAWSTLL